jgi:NADH dehydrogenase
MILVVGATGQLGGLITRRLLAQGRAVRILVRTPSHYGPLVEAGAQVAIGDLRDPVSLSAACQGAEIVITTAIARWTEDAATAKAINLDGYHSLIDAAKAAGVRHFIFTAGLGADPNSPVPFLAAKGQTKAYLRASGMPYTILEPVALMDMLIALAGMPALNRQPVWVLGEGLSLHSYVAPTDVAAFAVAAVDCAAALNRTIVIGGPQAISVRDAAALFEHILSYPVTVKSFDPSQPLPPGVPPDMLPLLAGFAAADVVVDGTQVAREFGVRLTPPEEYLRGALAALAVSQ